MGGVRLSLRDRKEALRFISSLDRRTIKARFSSLEHWRTDHVSIVYLNGHAVAMADAIDTADGRGATASLIARPGYGAYAVHALVYLQRQVRREIWFSTLREPTAATLAISRRYFDLVYDQGAWELYEHLAKNSPVFQRVRPTPIATTRRMLSEFGLPPIDQFTSELRREVLSSALVMDPNRPWRAPNGQIAGVGLMPIIFDLIDFNFRDRQLVTRFTMIALAAQFGHDVDTDLAGKIADPTAFARFNDAIRFALSEELSPGL